MQKYLGIGAVWLIALIIISPSGNFPLNDDWAFSLPVKWLIETGELQFTDWQFMSLIGQVIVGWAVTLVTGFSQDALRLTTLVTLLGTSLAIAYWASEKGLGSRWAALLGLTFLLNPVTLNLSATFMTDTPFTAALVAAIVTLDTARTRGTIGSYVLGWSLVLLACSIRQLGFCVAIAFAAATYFDGEDKRLWIARSILPTALLAGLLAVYPRILDHYGILPAIYNIPTQNLKAGLIDILTLNVTTIKIAIKTALIALAYVSLGLLPVTAFWAVRKMIAGNFRRQAVIAGIAALTALVLWQIDRLFPLTLNIFYDTGLGPLTIDGGDIPGPRHTALFFAITALACYSAVAVLAALTALATDWVRTGSWPIGKEDFSIRFVGFAFALYFAPLLLILPWFDRYLLPALAMALMLVACLARRYDRSNLGAPDTTPMSASITVLAVFGLFGAFATHDYIEWNRQRWAIVNDLTAQGVDKQDIDGGFEANNYLERLDGDIRRPVGAISIERKGARYLVSLRSAVEGYRAVSSKEASTYLGTSPARVYLHERNL